MVRPLFVECRGLIGSSLTGSSPGFVLRIRRWNSVGGRANEFLELASNSGNWGQGSGDWGSRNSGWDPLFVLPLIRSLLQLIGPHPTLLFLESFRYPLAGEFAMVTDLGWIIRVPGD